MGILLARGPSAGQVDRLCRRSRPVPALSGTLLLFTRNVPAATSTVFLFDDGYVWVQIAASTTTSALTISVAISPADGFCGGSRCHSFWNVDKMSKEFYFLLILLSLGAYGFFIALDLFTLFFFLQLAVIPVPAHRHLGQRPEEATAR